MVSKSRKRHKKPKRSIPKQSFIMLGLVIILVGVFIYFRFMHGSAPGSNKSVVAYVNGEPVYYSELQELKSMAERTPYLSQAITEESLLDVLITQRLLKQAAKAAGIVVTEEEFNKTMEAYFQQTNLNKGNFTALLNSLGIPYESFKRDMINTLYLYKYINKTILPLINISNETLFNYYTSNLESFTQPEMVYAAHILVNSSELAEELLNKINQGANFTELAKNYSQGYMAPMGGVLGWFTRDKFPKEFTDVAFSLDIGEVSDVVKTDYGWHIIKVLNKSEPKVMDFSEVRSWIELTLKAQQQGELLNQRIAELKEKAKIQILLETNTTSSSSTKDIGSFRDTGSGGECFENGKPVIRLFTTSTCPHCR
ncbi:peptidylprolyl isomerase [Candidatus Woesearchaeota archaeon]|nr:peptidylprolyl isomerase [Candidatus Woesearchaeota archaeon]